MRVRNVRLFSISDVARTDRNLQPVPERSPALAAIPSAERIGLELPLADATLVKPAELTWWDWAVFLLHTAAEIEHALLVQYLYAAYSLADHDFLGPAVPRHPGDVTRKWRQAIVEIAREEMAHLLTVQNLLKFIGGPLNFDREDFPFLAFLYPFPFNALAKVVQRYRNAEIVWCQEEPQNMGAWNFVDRRIEQVLGGLDVAAKRPRFAGRAEAASPATGLFKRHVEEQAQLVDEALAA